MITTHQFRFPVHAKPTAEEAALAFVRTFGDVPDGIVRDWAQSSNYIVAARWNGLLAARDAMGRKGL